MIGKLPDTLKNTIVIAGANGLIAKALRYSFETLGCHVTTISDRPNQSSSSITWNDVKKVGLPTQTSSVINACGKNIFSPTTFNQSLINEIYESRVGTNLILREAILNLKEKPKSFLTMSGVGIYKTDPSIVHDENSTEFNDDFWTDLVTKWEKASELPQNCPTRRIMLRTGAVLSRQGGMIQNMYPSFYLGFGGCIGDGNQYMPFIHIKDLARLIVFCCEMNEMNGVVNAVAPKLCTNIEFTKALAKTMRRPHLFKTPEWLIKASVSKERAAILLGSVKVYPKKALDHGFDFIYPEIYAAMSGLVDLKY